MRGIVWIRPLAGHPWGQAEVSWRCAENASTVMPPHAHELTLCVLGEPRYLGGCQPWQADNAGSAFAFGRSADDHSCGALLDLSTLWMQLTGTWCNLRCAHCINASGPQHPWLKCLDTETVKRSIREAEGARGQGDLLHRGRAVPPRDILELLGFSLQVAPTTVLTNGTLIDATDGRRACLACQGDALLPRNPRQRG